MGCAPPPPPPPPTVHYAFQPDIMHRGFNRPFRRDIRRLICNSCYLEGTFDPLSVPIGVGRRLKVASCRLVSREREGTGFSSGPHGGWYSPRAHERGVSPMRNGLIVRDGLECLASSGLRSPFVHNSMAACIKLQYIIHRWNIFIVERVLLENRTTKLLDVEIDSYNAW